MSSWVQQVRGAIVLGVLIMSGLNGCTIQPTAVATEDRFTAPVETYHYVNKGETIYDIANLYGRSVEELARWNNLSPPYALLSHQKLLVSGPSSSWDSAISVVPVTPYDPIVVTPLPNYAAPTRKAPRQSVAKAPTQSSPITHPVTRTRQGKLYHVVQRGQTLYSIAKYYGKEYRQLASSNGLSPPYALAINQELLVGTTGSASSSVKTVRSSGSSYRVQVGDTLYSIARQFGRTVQELTAWNSLSSTNLKVGQQLAVGSSGKQGVTATSPVASSPIRGTSYQVVKGDTLYSVSRRSGHAVETLASWNRLTPPYTLETGQVLRLSSSKGGASKASVSKLSVGTCHRVAVGETLYSLAKRYGHSVNQVASWNGLTPPYTLSLGNVLAMSASAYCH